MTTLLLLFALACTEKAPPDSPTELPAAAPEAPVGLGEPAVDGAGVAGGEEAAGPPKTPQDLYAECKDRVEGPEQAGECTTDADCARAGCGQEVCTTGKNVAEVVTTCEMRPCFQVLDTCGCREGTCSWALKAEAPAPGRRIPRPEDVPQ